MNIVGVVQGLRERKAWRRDGSAGMEGRDEEGEDGVRQDEGTKAGCGAGGRRVHVAANQGMGGRP